MILFSLLSVEKQQLPKDDKKSLFVFSSHISSMAAFGGVGSGKAGITLVIMQSSATE